MTDCNRPARKYKDDLKAHADGELPLPRRFIIRRHLTHCASCREEISDMTQITEELRTSETDAPLPASLRERILKEPGIENAGLLGKSASSTEDSPVAERLSSSSPVIDDRGKQAKPHRNPRVLAWGLAGAAVIAWFVLFPMFQQVRENSRRTTLADSVQMAYQLKQSVSSPSSSQAAGLPSPNTARGMFANPATPTGVVLDTTDLSQRQVHKEASIAVQVSNPEDASDAIETQVKENGGFVVNNTLSTGGDTTKTAELIVKVPVTQFEGFLRQVARLGIVQSKNITGEDITEQASDADQSESVLESDVQQSQTRLNALGLKAKWRDEQAARDLRIQLAQAQARLVLLKRMAALATVTIDLSQTPKPAVAPPVTGGFLTGLKDTTHDALQSLLSSAGALLALLIWLLAYAPLWIPAYFVGRYALKEYRKRQVV